MTLYNARICLDCGSLDWYIRQYATTTITGRAIYKSEENGHYEEDFDRDDDNNYDSPEWEDSDDGPRCQECDSDNLLVLESLTAEQFKYLYNVDHDERAEVAENMVNGVYEFPEDLKKKKRKGLIGAKPVRQC